MAEPVEDAAAQPQAEVVATDMLCRQCGGEPGGLPVDAVCPACGASVRDFVSGEPLCRSDPAWVRMLWIGARLMLAGTGLAMIIGIASVLVMAWSTRPDLARYLFRIAWLGTLLELAGSWLLTQPDPRGDRYCATRQCVRVVLAFTALKLLLDFAATAAPTIVRPSSLLHEAGPYVGVVGLFAKIQYVEKLANRIPAPTMSLCAAFLKIGYPLSDLMVVVCGVVGSSNRRTPAVNWAASRGATALLFVCCFAMLYWVLLWRFGSAVRREADRGKETLTVDGSTRAAQDVAEAERS